jgi:hypothetical protein
VLGYHVDRGRLKRAVADRAVQAAQRIRIVELLDLPGFEVPLKLVQDLVVVKLAGYLKHLGGFVRLLGW